MELHLDDPQTVLGPYHLVDCDAHFTEPPDLWTSRAPASLKDRVPRVRKVDGQDRWFIEEDQPFGGVGLCIVDKDGRKHYDLGVGSLPTFDRCHEAAYDVKARVRLMDELGIWAQIVYPNTGGLSSSKYVTDVGDKQLGLACVKIYNEAMAEVQAESGDRVLPMALLPVWDREEMLREAERCVGLGMRGFVISDKPEFQGLPGFRTDHWAPVLEFCSETETSLNFHIGGDPSTSPLLQFPWSDFGPETQVAIWTCMFSMSNARTIANWCYSGLLDKYRGLKLVSVESGMGWIPYLLEAMEYQFDEMMPNEGKRLERRPKEYFRDHFYATFWFEDFGPSVVEQVGVNNCLVETDFPHPTCLFPHQEHIAAVARKWSPEVARRVLQDNGAELYKVRLPTPEPSLAG